ncbi:MAG TPA: SdiA-regulated domain-containing protein [Vicinamibacteria bacterium]|nr:SdiA-regulated domain-containing protein [Vicinamibacteria bacterium]
MRVSSLVLAVAALLACSDSTPAAGARQGKAGKKQKQGPEQVLGPGTAVANPGVAEPSGIVFHPALQRLFVVGDEGTLAELDADGGFVRRMAVGANLEDVAVHDPSGALVLLDEVRAELIVYDPRASAVKGRWRLDAAALTNGKERGRDGFEGLAFRPEAGRPGGGVFYLAHQRGPALLVAVAFDPTGSGGEIGGAAVIGRWKVEGYRDLNALSWSPALGRLLLLADAEDALLVVQPDGTVEKRVPVPGL